MKLFGARLSEQSQWVIKRISEFALSHYPLWNVRLAPKLDIRLIAFGFLVSCWNDGWGSGIRTHE